jgi:hypothetical protein
VDITKPTNNYKYLPLYVETQGFFDENWKLTGADSGRPSSRQPEWQPAAPEIELLVKQALEDRMPLSFPYQALLTSDVGLRRELPAARLTIGPDALPSMAGYTFELASSTTAQAEANRTMKYISIVTVDRPSIAGDRATLWMGVSTFAPAGAFNVMCCCAREATYVLREGRWMFSKWGEDGGCW